MSFISSLGEWLRKVSKSFMSATISGKTITLTRHNGDTVTLTTQDTTYELASQSTSGLMSSTDKQKLDAIPSDAVFTDTVTTVSVTGSGNAITDITASNGALTAEKNQTFSLSDHTHSGYVEKTGDTMSGALTVNAHIYAPFHIWNTFDSGELQVHGGTGWHGGILTLHGKDQTNLKGFFRLIAHDGTVVSILEGRPDGTFHWNGQPIAIVAAQSIGNSSGYIKFSNNLQFVWGDVGVTTNGTTVTFARAFASGTTPRVVFGESPSSVQTTVYNATAYPISATSMTMYQHETSGRTGGFCSFLAIGKGA